MDNVPAILVARQFHSFEELAELAVGFDADFRQIGKEQSKSEIFQAQLGSMLISNGRFGCHLYQGGSTPMGMRTFAVLSRCSPPMYWYHHFVDHDCLMIFPTHGEIDVISHPDFEVQTFSLPESVLADCLSGFDYPDPARVLENVETVVRVPAAALDNIRALLHQAKQFIVTVADENVWEESSSNLQTEIIFQVLDVLGKSGPHRLSWQKPTERSLRDLLDYIDTHLEESLSLTELCALTEFSERTVRNLFQKAIGLSPMAYVKGKRLSHVHRNLRRGLPGNMRVSDVANQWGFWHMGQFARDYKALFRELPSETLHRTN